MYIGEASKITGLSVKAIRFYEEVGLIKSPKRLGRYRVYTEADIELLLLIKEAKELGVKLSELKEVVIYKNGKVDWKNIKTFMLQIKRRLTAEMEDLQNRMDKIDECCNQINA